MSTLLTNDCPTGQMLHFRFVFPCSRYRLKLGLIDLGDFYRLGNYAKEGHCPSDKFLRYCFPGAFADLKEFAKRKGKDVWDIETVADFWQHHHSHKESPVHCGKVVSIDSHFVTVEVSGKITRTTNPFMLMIKPGDEVFFHQRVIGQKK